MSCVVRNFLTALTLYHLFSLISASGEETIFEFEVGPNFVSSVEVLIQNVLETQREYLERKRVRYVFLNFAPEELAGLKKQFFVGEREFILLSPKTMVLKQLKGKKMIKNKDDRKNAILIEIIELKELSHKSVKIDAVVAFSSEDVQTWRYYIQEPYECPRVESREVINSF